MAARRKRNTADSSITTEIYGLVILAFGILFFLSVLTYDQSDPTFWAMSDANEYVGVQNFLGIAGASLAEPVQKYTFGYSALVFPVLIMLIGVYMMAGFPLRDLTRYAALSLGWAFLISIMLATPESLRTNGNTLDYYPSGLIGGFLSDWTVRFFGWFALGFFSVVLFLVLLMSTFRVHLSIIPLFIAEKLRILVEATRTGFSRAAAWFQNVKWLPERSEKPAKPAKAGKEKKSDRFRIGRVLRKPEKPAVEEAAVERVVADAYEEERIATLSDLDGIPTEDAVPVNSANGQEMPASPTLGAAGTPTDQETMADAGVAPPPEDIEIQNEGDPGYVFPASYDDTVPDTDQFRVDEAINTPDEVELPEQEDYDELVEAAMANFEMPPTDILHKDEAEEKISREELMANADLLENTLSQFGVKAFVKKVIEGPVITLYAVRPAEGVKINQVVSLSDDLALAMRAKGIRMIAPIPGEAAIGIEIPNRKPSTVFFESIMRSEKFTEHGGKLTIGMGKTIGGEVFCADLTRMPHLLIAGATGAGKSVGINTIISSILYRVPPSDVKFVLIDPKKLELSLYARLKDHYLAICPELDEIVITHPQNAILILKSVVNEMEERYDQLASVGVRDIISYNNKIKKFEDAGKKDPDLRRLPYIVVIIDELADLILTASREVEEPITRLAQMARAVGIHLIVATQRPSVDILTGLIKANFPTRIAYQVATRPDSKVILDMYGAEKLIGNGDFLFLPPGTGKPVRLQNPFVSTEEVDALIEHIRSQPKFPPYELKLERSKEITLPAAAKRAGQDEFFSKAREIVIRHQQGSISLLQRKLKIGYARAARLIDELEEAGVVGPGQGSKARDVLISSFSED